MPVTETARKVEKNFFDLARCPARIDYCGSRCPEDLSQVARCEQFVGAKGSRRNKTQKLDQQTSRGCRVHILGSKGDLV